MTRIFLTELLSGIIAMFRGLDLQDESPVTGPPMPAGAAEPWTSLWLRSEELPLCH